MARFYDEICKTKIEQFQEIPDMEKYQGFWLLISYESVSFLSCFTNQKVKKYIFDKLMHEQEELILSINDIFTKILFLPFNNENQIFEFPK